LSTQTLRTPIHFRLWLILIAFGLCCSVAAQVTIHIPGDQATIQAAINAANNGDTVLVAPGTYTENINFNGKAITLSSSGGASVTTIDGGAKTSVVTFNSAETSNAVLNGFTIRNGATGNGTPQNDGGGIYIYSASPTITNNIIQNNTACGDGAGIAVEFASPLIQGNTIQNNMDSGCSGGNGGGIAIGGAASAQIIGNLIMNNGRGSGNGGGISLFAAGTPTIRNNVITGNTATGLSPAAQGGGIYIVNQSDALIVQNLIYNNNAGQSNGIYFLVPSGDRGPILVNNTVIGGPGGSQGSAIYADGFDNQVQLFNNLLIGLSGQNAINCSGTYSQQPPVFSNNDAFSSGGTGLAGTCAAESGQNGNISADPQFVNTAGGDYHLQTGSPGIDAGINSAANLPQSDYAGNPRILDGNNDCVSTVDMGIYELVAAANANFSSNSLTFPDQAIGTSGSAQPVTLSNTGTTCFQLSNIQITGDFTQVNNCSAKGVRGGTSCVFNVTFTPTAVGSRLGALTVTGSDGTAQNRSSVSLRGSGFSSQPAVSISPGSLSFSTQTVGTTSAAQVVSLTNTGNAPLSISGITTTPSFSQTNNCPASLAAGTGCAISVKFSPSDAGAQSGTLTITDNAVGSPQNVNLNGTGVDFSVSATPASASVKHSQSVTFNVALSPGGGPFNSAVTLACSGLPSSAACTFSPSSAVPGSNGARSVLTLSTSGKTPRGVFNVVISGNSGVLEHSTSISLTVN
jgi:Abnormal spindle-like microcephaly-assoc'd, ASPM-SPD-2-Hydin/Right handed beta helix region